MKKKEGGKFEKVAYWRIPPIDKEKWRHRKKVMKPEWM